MERLASNASSYEYDEDDAEYAFDDDGMGSDGDGSGSNHAFGKDVGEYDTLKHDVKTLNDFMQQQEQASISSMGGHVRAGQVGPVPDMTYSQAVWLAIHPSRFHLDDERASAWGLIQTLGCDKDILNTCEHSVVTHTYGSTYQSSA